MVCLAVFFVMMATSGMVRGEDEGVNQAAKLNNVLRLLMNQRQSGCTGIHCSTFGISCPDACNLITANAADLSNYSGFVYGAFTSYGCVGGFGSNCANSVCNGGK
ncbi:unnamed protein product [Adineta steineri]|uniref:Uncharacterized protein n=1 Tax=Adineta steineri TaxID=433720 RepID=A0A814P9V3_9BILA|nr:unnamed protein product [Adineta steineri]CAF4183383.1 unnamed protein product [Adineta steineri]